MDPELFGISILSAASKHGKGLTISTCVAFLTIAFDMLLVLHTNLMCESAGKFKFSFVPFPLFRV